MHTHTHTHITGTGTGEQVGSRVGRIGVRRCVGHIGVRCARLHIAYPCELLLTRQPRPQLLCILIELARLQLQLRRLELRRLGQLVRRLLLRNLGREIGLEPLAVRAARGALALQLLDLFLQRIPLLGQRGSDLLLARKLAALRSSQTLQECWRLHSA